MTDLRCNLCGRELSTRFPQVLDAQTGESFAIAECAQCQLGHTTPRPSNLGRYYGTSYHGGRHGLTAKYCALRRIRFVEKLISSGNGRRLLDVGCGDGTFLLAARRRGWETIGTEFNPHIARSFGLNVRESVEDARSAGPFDCITLWHSLEHIPDPRKEILALGSMLRPGGVLLIAIPNAGGWQARIFGRHWLHLDVPRHLYHFNYRSLVALLELAGLSPVHRWDQEFEYDLLGWSQSALNAVMPAPNVFYRVIVGKQAGLGGGSIVVNSILGTLFSVLTLPAVLLGTLSNEGGTLIVAARRRNSQVSP
jgi:SAM-dependent methyltransferase